MKVYNHNIFVFLIKVFSQESYREDFINGKLYLKEAGYFNKLEDSFRGDKYDSKIVQNKPIIYIGNHIFRPDIMIQGFVGDDKVPILCTTILNEQSLDLESEDTLSIKNEVITELSQFGRYGLLFYYGELKENIDKACLTKNIYADQDIVKYVDFNNENEHLNIYKGDPYKKYFVKDISYKNQNELRFIFLSNRTDKFTPLITKENDYYILQTPKLLFYHKFDITEGKALKIKKLSYANK